MRRLVTQRGRRRTIRPIVVGNGSRQYSGTTYDYGALGGVFPQWIGYVNGSGTLTNASNTITAYQGQAPAVGDKITDTGGVVPAATTVTAYDPVALTVTMSVVATGNATPDTLTFTGIAHPYPAAANGYWQFGLNMTTEYTASADGINTAALTSTISLLDAVGGVLTTSTAIINVAPLSITYNLPIEGAQQVTSFYGISMTTTLLGGLNVSGAILFLLDPTITVLDLQAE